MITARGGTWRSSGSCRMSPSRAEVSPQGGITAYERPTASSATDNEPVSDSGKRHNRQTNRFGLTHKRYARRRRRRDHHSAVTSWCARRPRVVPRTMPRRRALDRVSVLFLQSPMVGLRSADHDGPFSRVVAADAAHDPRTHRRGPRAGAARAVARGTAAGCLGRARPGHVGRRSARADEQAPGPLNAVRM